MNEIKMPLDSAPTRSQQALDMTMGQVGSPVKDNIEESLIKIDEAIKKDDLMKIEENQTPVASQQN